MTTKTATSTRSTAGLSELVVPALLLAMAIFLTIGIINMEVPPTASTPGPTFFPIIVTVVLVAMAVLYSIQVLRHRGTVEDDDDFGVEESVDEPAVDAEELTPPISARTPWPLDSVSDWRSVGIVVGSLALFTALLNPLGWLLSAALLFFGVAYALGDGKHPLKDLCIGVAMSSFVQIAFSGGLGLSLPPGILEGIF